MAIIDNLRISKEAMEAAISTFENKKTALENTYLKISNEVRVLDGTYHGEASEKFKSQFDQLYKNLQQTESVMSEVISKVKSVLALYSESEETITQMMNSAQSGTAYQSNL